MADRYGATLILLEADYNKPEVKTLIDGYPFEDFNAIDGLFRGYDPEARDGYFDELEPDLTELGIPFDRQSESYCGDPAILCQYRPDLYPNQWDTVIDHNSRPYIVCSDLELLLRMDLTDQEKLAELKDLIGIASGCPVTLQQLAKKGT
jgi:hypothetical protein